VGSGRTKAYNPEGKRVRKADQKNAGGMEIARQSLKEKSLRRPAQRLLQKTARRKAAKGPSDQADAGESSRRGGPRNWV